MKLDTPLIKVIRASRRLNIALFGVLPLLLVLGGVLYWGAQRILQQEEEKLRIDFSVLVGYIHAHETVLQSLHAQGLNPDGRRLVTATPVRETPGFDRAAGEFFDGQHAIAAMPFSLLCQSPDACPVVDGVFTGIGGYLSDFYSTRWAASVYPAAPLFIISPSQQLSVSVPAISTVSGFEPLTRQTFLSVVDAVGRAAGGADPEDRSNGEGPRVTWLRDADLPDMLIGMLPVTLPLNTRDGIITTRRSVYAVSLLSRGRVSISEQVLREPLYYQFWLQRKGTGVLIGEGAPPAVGQPGFHFGGDGLVLRIADRTDSWTGYYKLNYGSFFRANMWLPITVLLMLGLGLAAGAVYLLWYNRRVIQPAEIAHLDMVESEEFNRTVLDTAPVALCVLSRLDGRVVFGNALAIQWLGIAVGEQPRDSPEANKLLRQVLGAARPGTIETFRTHEGRPLFVAFAPTRYKKQDVVLCAFADISARAEMEHTLAQAKQQADRANEAKSTFLATMSHEIRTPLYGVLGTLEVLSLTHLDDEQRRHVDRIQDSSVILQQLISDILDITKIESGQLGLEMDGFDPRELVQHCVASYAGMAEQKGLVIYSCIDTSTPAWVVGDGGRIRQILNNLVNNAIKFTDSGHVVARLRAEVLPDGRARLYFQVVDSGVGISAENQVCLFEPFYQIDSGSHLVRGAGIGLSICARLAELMGSTIQVTSELGLGSSFSIAIDLDTAEPPPGPSPRLDGLRVYVRSARKELSENICQWLAYWGAQASVAPAVIARDEDSDGVLVDVHIVGDAAAPTELAGAGGLGRRPRRARRRAVPRRPPLPVQHRLRARAMGPRRYRYRQGHGDASLRAIEPAHPGGRGQSDQPGDDVRSAGATGLPGDGGAGRRRGAGAMEHRSVRRGADRRQHASHERLRTGRRVARAGRDRAHHRRHGQCAQGRRSALQGGGHEQLAGQADQAESALEPAARRSWRAGGGASGNGRRDRGREPARRAAHRRQVPRGVPGNHDPGPGAHGTGRGRWQRARPARRAASHARRIRRGAGDGSVRAGRKRRGPVGGRRPERRGEGVADRPGGIAQADPGRTLTPAAPARGHQR